MPLPPTYKFCPIHALIELYTKFGSDPPRAIYKFSSFSRICARADAIEDFSEPLEDILTKDTVLDLISKFIFVEVKEKVDDHTGKVKRSENLIFPRYHQLDVIRKLLADVRVNRTAQNYLIQHSAGSGKTNSIAWLAHRLTSLHDADNKIIFDISICQLILEGMLLTTDSGEYKLASFVDEQRMNRLYEKFILEYYAKECPQVTATASQIPWVLDDGIGTMLPVMQSDIMLTRGNEVLIIDAKYYTHTTQTQYNVHTLHSSNLYQIFTYVKNKDAEFGSRPHTVSGMLLYAATDEAIQPDNRYQMSGNKISVRTLDLNQEFSEIASQLNAIVDEHFSAN